MEEEGRNDKTHAEWQDNIAKQILTMYAASKLSKPATQQRAKSLLDFIGEPSKIVNNKPASTLDQLEEIKKEVEIEEKAKEKSKKKKKRSALPPIKKSKENSIASKTRREHMDSTSLIEALETKETTESAFNEDEYAVHLEEDDLGNDVTGDSNFNGYYHVNEASSSSVQQTAESPQSLKAKPKKAKKKVPKKQDAMVKNLNDISDFFATRAKETMLESADGMTKTQALLSSTNLHTNLLPESFRKTTKFRTCHIVKNEKGEDVAIRGSPRCYPLWFSANAELGNGVLNWQELPGGENVQAHLNSMYEKGQWEEYISMVAQILGQMCDVDVVSMENPLKLSEQQSLRRVDSPSNWGFATGSEFFPTQGLIGSRSGVASSAGTRGNSAAGMSAKTMPLSTPKTMSAKPGSALGIGSRASRGEDDIAFDVTDSGVSYADQLLAIQSKKGLFKEEKNSRKSASRSKLGTSQTVRFKDETDESSTLIANNSEETLPKLEAEGDQDKDLVEMIVLAQSRQRANTASVSAAMIKVTSVELQQRYWKQLVSACVAFSTLFVGKKDFTMAMKMLLKAEDLVKDVKVYLTRLVRSLKYYVKELTEGRVFTLSGKIQDSVKLLASVKGHMYNALAYYFYASNNKTASILHTKQALKLHQQAGDNTYYAASLLHLSCIEIQQTRFKSAHKVLYEFLAFVESEETPEFSGNFVGPEQLCIVAIGYHNLAVCQLKLECSDLACKSILNARKIARLCLSYSNRWITTFQWTFDVCLEDVKFQMATKKYLSKEIFDIVEELTSQFFNPVPDLEDTSPAEVNNLLPKNHASNNNFESITPEKKRAFKVSKTHLPCI